MAERVPGTFALVLHSHLPWLAHHGRWPVGEEWLHQSWAASYLPVTDVLRRLAAEGRTDLLTLGVTPVLAEQLDDPHCLSAVHAWLGGWALRAQEAGTRRAELGDTGAREHRLATAAIEDFETHWRHGGSPVLRGLADAGAVELLGGPLTHPFQPLLHPRLRRFALEQGLADGHRRFGRGPAGIWAPECGYSPGMERGYADAGVTHLMVDGPALHGDTASARTLGDTDVVAFGRDLAVSYRVWSPRSGYPGHAAYRDFHTFDHPSGLKPSRVTGRSVAPEDKAPYDPDRAAAAVAAHAADFVATVRRRLLDEADRTGRPALVVAAFDTELFGHWWHEGPAWLEAVLRALPEAGVTVSTLAGAAERGHVGGPVDLPRSSWGSGKDWRVWDGPAVADLVELGDDVVATALAAVDARLPGTTDAGVTGAGAVVRDPVADQLLREALLTTSSDWAFMVSKDSAAEYARTRAWTHAHAVREIAGAAGREAAGLAARWRLADGPFAGLDARALPAAGVP